jgi:thiosulfate dehydrogenase [quinone] large subunit
MMENQSSRLMLGSVSLIAAYEFVVSGLDKIVSGRFPAGLGMALMDGADTNPNQWYIRWLHATIMPHAVAWGYVIEWSEFLIGLALLLGAARWLLWPLVAPIERQRLAASLTLLSVVAALVGAAMTFNFHLYMGKSPIALVSPANPFDEGVDLDLTLTLALLTLATVNALTFSTFQQFCSTQIARVMRLLPARLQPPRTVLVER